MEAKDKHAFTSFPGGRCPRSCIKCGLPPEAEVHRVFEIPMCQPTPAARQFIQETLDLGAA